MSFFVFFAALFRPMLRSFPSFLSPFLHNVPFLLQLVLELGEFDLDLSQAVVLEDRGVGLLRARMGRRRRPIVVAAVVLAAVARAVPDGELVGLDVARGAGAADRREADAVVHFFEKEREREMGEKKDRERRLFLCRRFGKL